MLMESSGTTFHSGNPQMRNATLCVTGQITLHNALDWNREGLDIVFQGLANVLSVGTVVNKNDLVQ